MVKRTNRSWLSLPQAAICARRSRAKLLVLGVTGDIEVQEFGGRVFVSRESLDALLAREAAAASASTPESIEALA
jgi:hypothetical protein